MFDGSLPLYGGIPKMGVPLVIIQLNGIFPYKASILGTPIFGNPHLPSILICVFLHNPYYQLIFIITIIVHHGKPLTTILIMTIIIIS